MRSKLTQKLLILSIMISVTPLPALASHKHRPAPAPEPFIALPSTLTIRVGDVTVSPNGDFLTAKTLDGARDEMKVSCWLAKGWPVSCDGFRCAEWNEFDLHIEYQGTNYRIYGGTDACEQAIRSMRAMSTDSTPTKIKLDLKNKSVIQIAPADVANQDSSKGNQSSVDQRKDPSSQETQSIENAEKSDSALAR